MPLSVQPAGARCFLCGSRERVERERMLLESRQAQRRGAESGAWLAGVEFGRMRHQPTEAEREVWRACGRLRVFLSGVRHGRTLSPRGEQMVLGLRVVA